MPPSMPLSMLPSLPLSMLLSMRQSNICLRALVVVVAQVEPMSYKGACLAKPDYNVEDEQGRYIPSLPPSHPLVLAAMQPCSHAPNHPTIQPFIRPYVHPCSIPSLHPRYPLPPQAPALATLQCELHIQGAARLPRLARHRCSYRCDVAGNN